MRRFKVKFSSSHILMTCYSEDCGTKNNNATNNQKLDEANKQHHSTLTLMTCHCAAFETGHILNDNHLQSDVFRFFGKSIQS